jgi:hypothetical protein
MKYGKFKVTQEDIDHATPGDSLNCPISRAVQKLHPSKQIITSFAFGTIDCAVRAKMEPMVFIADDFLVPSQKLLLTKDAKQFMINFDNGEKVEPCTFEYREIESCFKEETT